MGVKYGLFISYEWLVFSSLLWFIQEIKVCHMYHQPFVANLARTGANRGVSGTSGTTVHRLCHLQIATLTRPIKTLNHSVPLVHSKLHFHLCVTIYYLTQILIINFFKNSPKNKRSMHKRHKSLYPLLHLVSSEIVSGTVYAHCATCALSVGCVYRHSLCTKGTLVPELLGELIVVLVSYRDICNSPCRSSGWGSLRLCVENVSYGVNDSKQWSYLC